MKHQLTTFLGGTRETDLAKRYRKTRYDIEGAVSEPSEYFGSALEQYLKPDCTLILGTTGSMWDVLLETFGLTDSNQALYESLYEQVCGNSVSSQSLQALQLALQPSLHSILRLELIPYGLQASEQQQILEVMSHGIGAGDRVSMDITHGLRHLPLLAQTSALYIAQVRKAEVAGIYYGALELQRDGVTPVANLSGLLDIAAWSAAVAAFEKDADYSVFTPHLEQQNSQLARTLEGAAFDERNIRHSNAAKQLRRVPMMLANQPLSGVGALFEQEILDRTAWPFAMGAYQHQRQLAYTYLSSGDYLRCVLYAFEAFISLLAEGHHGDRRVAKEFFEQETNEHRNPDWPAYRTLRSIRNMIAHGDQSDWGKQAKLLDDEAQLRQTLTEIMRKLLPKRR